MLGLTSPIASCWKERAKAHSKTLKPTVIPHRVLWGIVYSNHNQNPPKKDIGNVKPRYYGLYGLYTEKRRPASSSLSFSIMSQFLNHHKTETIKRLGFRV